MEEPGTCLLGLPGIMPAMCGVPLCCKPELTCMVAANLNFIHQDLVYATRHKGTRQEDSRGLR